MRPKFRGFVFVSLAAIAICVTPVQADTIVPITRTLHNRAQLSGDYKGLVASTDANENVLPFDGAQAFRGSISPVILSGVKGDSAAGLILSPHAPRNADVNAAVVPISEPSSLVLFGTGLLCFGGMIRRMLKAQARGRLERRNNAQATPQDGPIPLER